jgi:hypothetical protein
MDKLPEMFLRKHVHIEFLTASIFPHCTQVTITNDHPIGQLFTISIVQHRNKKD